MFCHRPVYKLQKMYVGRRMYLKPPVNYQFLGGRFVFELHIYLDYVPLIVHNAHDRGLARSTCLGALKSLTLLEWNMGRLVNA